MMKRNTKLTNKYSQLKYILDGGSLKNRYQLVFSVPTSDAYGTYINDNAYYINVLCQATSIPERKLNNPQVTYYRGRKTLMRSMQDYNDTWEITVVEDSNYNLRKTFEQWLIGCDSPENSNIWSNYKTNIRIYQLAPDGKSTIFGYEISDAFISSIGSVEFDDSATSEIVKYTVTISYSACAPVLG